MLKADKRGVQIWGFNTYERPLGLPNNVTVELAKRNGGMIYRLAGTTTDQNLAVRVCPGLAKESMVVSVIEGNHLNGKLHGTLRQQTPYVVQRNGNKYLTTDGQWIDQLDPIKTHIPLELYEFKGWE